MNGIYPTRYLGFPVELSFGSPTLTHLDHENNIRKKKKNTNTNEIKDDESELPSLNGASNGAIAKRKDRDGSEVENGEKKTKKKEEKKEDGLEDDSIEPDEEPKGEGVVVSGCGINASKYAVIKTFADAKLPEEDLDCCKSFDCPSSIQSHAWPFLLDGRDFVGIAATGSDVLCDARTPCGLKTVCVYGGTFKGPQISALNLIATDVASRGLDIPDVEVAINYSFPLTTESEDCVHRTGRTGRAGKKGVAHTFFMQENKGLAGKLVNVLREAGQIVPVALTKFGVLQTEFPKMTKMGSHILMQINGDVETLFLADWRTGLVLTIFKESKLYGAHFKEIRPCAPKSTKITFDDSDNDE